MADVRFEIVIERPLDEVFAVLTDPEKTAAWSSSTEEERWLTPPPHGVGSRRVAVTRILGRLTENEAEVVAFEPDRSWTLRSVRGPAFETSAEFSEVATGTRVMWRWRFGRGSVSSRLMRPFVPLFRRRFDADLARLKEYMEQGTL